MDDLSAAAAPAPVDVAEEEAVRRAPAVLRMLWADPQYMPEHLALWSLTHFGPKAASAVRELSDSHPEREQEELGRMVIEHQTRLSMSEGAVVGGPFIVLIPFAFCVALLAQAQMALELAALTGHAPSDQMRAADLLVLQGAYGSTVEASGALAQRMRAPGRREGGRLPRGSRISMIRRMAYMLGILGSGGEKPSRLRSALHLALIGLLFLVGLVLPLVWVPYIGAAFRRSGLRMGERASRFYAEGRTEEAGITVIKASTVRIRMAPGQTRTWILIVLPVIAGVIALSTGADFAGGTWSTSGILLVTLSALTTLGWLAHRWWRRRHRAADAAAVA